MEKLTHWKKTFHPEFLGAHDFQPGEEITATIERFNEAQEVTGTGGKKETVTALFLKGFKPLILNRTNAKLISKALKTPYMEQWTDKAIQLYVQAGVKAFGEVVDAVRVRPIAPKLTKPTLDTERFAAMLDSIEAGKFSVEQAKTKFALTSDQIDLLP